MSKETDRILEGLTKAMQAEVDGHNFYKMAAGSTTDELGKETFISLAKDEADHFIFLKAQHDSISKTGKVDPAVKLGKPSQSADSPIFSTEFKTRIKEAHYEMSALSIGAQLELTSIQFYRAEAKAAADPQIKAFYDELAEWETTHHRRLIQQQQELREDYYYKGGFYPF